MTKTFIRTFLCLLLTVPAFAQGKLFIIGGGTRTPELMSRMVKESGMNAQEDYVMIVTFASEEPDTSYMFASKDFVSAGVKHLAHLDSGRITAAALDSLRGAKLIFLTGGDQSRFMKTANTNGASLAIQEAYLKGSLIAGTSAGAAVISERMISGREKRHPEYSETYRHIERNNIELISGLGLLKSVIIDQHFVVRSRHNRLITAVVEVPDCLGIGIDEATALLVEGARAEVVGESQVLIYSNPARSHSVRNIKLGARDLRLSLYLPGEKFTLPN